MEQKAVFLDEIESFIQELSVVDQAKIAANVSQLVSGDFASVRVKQLDGAIHELIVKQYRLIFFRKGSVIYVVSAFRKKSAKTPLREIRRARDIFRII